MLIIASQYLINETIVTGDDDDYRENTSEYSQNDPSLDNSLEVSLSVHFLMFRVLYFESVFVEILVHLSELLIPWY